MALLRPRPARAVVKDGGCVLATAHHPERVPLIDERSGNLLTDRLLDGDGDHGLLDLGATRFLRRGFRRERSWRASSPPFS
jgi:hypothetical protein